MLIPHANLTSGLRQPEIKASYCFLRHTNLPKMLEQLDWTLFIAPADKCFFTSDNPVSKWAPPGKRGLLNSVGIANPDVEVVFPVSRRALAFGYWSDTPRPLYCPIPSDGVDYLTSE